MESVIVRQAAWDAYIRRRHHLDPREPIYFRPGAMLPLPPPPPRVLRWWHRTTDLALRQSFAGQRAAADSGVRLRFYLQEGAIQFLALLHAALGPTDYI